MPRADGIVFRPQVSPWFLWAAEHHAALALRVEQAESGSWLEHRAYVLSAITQSAAFVEAAINELFQDVDDRQRGELSPGDQLTLVTAGLPQALQQRMTGYWRGSRGRGPALEKVKALVAMAGVEDLAPDVVGDGKTLFRMRNALVHFTPKDQYVAQQSRDFEHELLEKRGVAENPLAQGNQPAYWPERAMSAALATWSADVAETLIEEMARGLGLTLNVAKHRAGNWFNQEPGTLSIESDVEA